MLTHYGPYVAYEIQYDTGGHPINPQEESDFLAALQAGVDGAEYTDVIVFSHGWNNDIADARSLYMDFFQNFNAASMLSPDKLHGRRIIVAGIFWPSKRFTDAQLIPGGAAATDLAVDAALNAQMDDMKVLFGANPDASARIEHARAQIPYLERSQSAQNDFVYTLAPLLPQPRGPVDEGLDEARTVFNDPSISGSTILARLSVPVGPVLPPSPGSPSIAMPPIQTAAGGAAGLGSIIGSVKTAASTLLNLFTYYTMKDRSGIVGSTGLAPTLSRILATEPANKRLHLIGHSFGSRVVTVAVNALPDTHGQICSMNLLQAAYSHNGLAENWDGLQHDGTFRNVVSQQKAERIMITHSVHDLAVGLAYPVASRLMNQVAAAIIGGPNDKFGGMGRNGAQHTPESFEDVLQPVGEKYAPVPQDKWVRNVNGDGQISGAVIKDHGDVRSAVVANAVLQNMCDGV